MVGAQRSIGTTLLDTDYMDFMFDLTQEENHALRSQNVTLKRGQHSKYMPFVFTEQGVAMLSSVLKSNQAIQANIQIMRTFTSLRRMIATHEDLIRKIESMEKTCDEHFSLVFEAIILSRLFLIRLNRHSFFWYIYPIYSSSKM